MTSMLRDDVNVGTATRALALGRRTSLARRAPPNENVDAVVLRLQRVDRRVSWIGYDQPRSLGANETGGIAALPIWVSFMQKALKGVPEKPLQPPKA
jgi:penicillin-binding protein 1A